MTLIKTAGNCGLVLDSGGRSAGHGRTGDRSSTPSIGSTAHFILKRYRVDDEGHVCLTPSLPLPELRGSVDILKAELESLLEQAENRFAEEPADR